MAHQSRRSRRTIQLEQQDQSRDEATFDSYDDELVRTEPVLEPPPARVRPYLVAFGPNGESFDGELIDTDGLSASEFIPGLGTDRGRRRLAQRIMEAHARLIKRIGHAK